MSRQFLAEVKGTVVPNTLFPEWICCCFELDDFKTIFKKPLSITQRLFFQCVIPSRLLTFKDQETGI
jgi:hypothetical protein